MPGDYRPLLKKSLNFYSKTIKLVTIRKKKFLSTTVLRNNFRIVGWEIATFALVNKQIEAQIKL